MKKLSLYVFLALMFCNVGFAIKVSDKILGKGRPDIVIECKFKSSSFDYTKYYGFNKIDAGNDLKWTFHGFDGKEKKFNPTSSLVASVQKEGNKITWDGVNDYPRMLTYLLHIDDSFKFPKTHDIKLDVFILIVENKKIINDIKDLAELQKELKETTTTNPKQHLSQLIETRQHFTDIQQAILKDNIPRKIYQTPGVIQTCSITSEKMENLEPVFVPKIKIIKKKTN